MSKCRVICVAQIIFGTVKGKEFGSKEMGFWDFVAANY